MTDRVKVSAAVIVRKSAGTIELLSARRTEPEFLAGGWEFPGGKWDLGEDALTALAREIDEELGVSIKVITQLPGKLPDNGWEMSTQYSLHVFIAELTPGSVLQLREQHDDLRWLPINNPLQVEWLEVDLPILAAAVDWLQNNYA